MDAHAGGGEGGDAAGPAWLVSEMLTDRLKLQRLNDKREKENKAALEHKAALKAERERAQGLQETVAMRETELREAQVRVRVRVRVRTNPDPDPNPNPNPNQGAAQRAELLRSEQRKEEKEDLTLTLTLTLTLFLTLTLTLTRRRRRTPSARCRRSVRRSAPSPRNAMPSS